jgi:hypothetical protein
MEVTVAFLRDEIARLIRPSLSFRRASVEEAGGLSFPNDAPATDDDVGDFIEECAFDSARIANALLSDANGTSTIRLSEKSLTQFRHDVEAWSQNNNWLAADGGFLVPDYPDRLVERRIAAEAERRFSADEIWLPEVTAELASFAPSILITRRLLDENIDLNRMGWRDLEKLIAELLEADGYDVELGPGSKDGGADLLAYRELPGVGTVKSVWQAKHQPGGRKVGIGVIRELADVRNEMKASKAIIVTTSYLTRGAIDRIKRERFLLGKVERSELQDWITKILRGRNGRPNESQ